MAKGRLARVEHQKPPENAEDQERKLQEMLSRILVAYHRHGHSAIIVLEGWDAAGKGGLIKRITAELDPRFCAVWPISAPNAQERREHYLTRFWARLPSAGQWSIFDRSWYGRVAVERVEGFAGPAEWKRAFGEINSFEEMEAANGTRIVKLFLHIDQEEQDKRLIDRLEQPWKRWKVNAEDFRNRSRRADYVKAYEEMFDKTDKPHARWHIIGANHKKSARLEGMRIIAETLSQGIDMNHQQLDPELRAMAEKAMNVKLKPK